MANPKQKLKTNTPGEFFVDDTCINCDTCRQLAPEVFGERDDYSYVAHQPVTDEENRNAVRALLCCPTGSIGTEHKNSANRVMNDFPLPLDQNGVFYCGFNSPKSYGGNSYYFQHPQGNWLVDSPKFLPHLVKRFEELGGLRYIFLTHQDDVADAHKYAEAFGAERIIHRADSDAEPDAEILLDGGEDTLFHQDIRIIPTPGHTAGHCVLLLQNYYLFTGDHMWWNPEFQELGASERYCWSSWEEQRASLSKLLDYRFEWVLPGHGDRIHMSQAKMHQALQALVREVTR